MHKITELLSMILFGIFLFYLLDPLVSWFQHFFRSHIPYFRAHSGLLRVCSVFCCLIFYCILIFSGVFLFSLNVLHYFEGMSWEDFLLKIDRAFSPFFFLFRRIMEYSSGTGGEESILSGIVDEKVTLFCHRLFESTLCFPGHLIRFFISLLLAVYLLTDKERFFSWLKTRSGSRKISAAKEHLEFFVLKSREVFSRYLKGQLLDVLVMGSLISAGLIVLKVPLGLSIGILSGAGNFIPYLGPLIAYFFTVFFCLLEAEKRTLFFALIYLVIVQQLDGSFIGPKLLGTQISIRPFFIILSVLAGGAFTGPVGMLLAVPSAGLIKELFHHYLTGERSSGETLKEQ